MAPGAGVAPPPPPEPPDGFEPAMQPRPPLSGKHLMPLVSLVLLVPLLSREMETAGFQPQAVPSEGNEAEQGSREWGCLSIRPETPISYDVPTSQQTGSHGSVLHDIVAFMSGRTGEVQRITIELFSL